MLPQPPLVFFKGKCLKINWFFYTKSWGLQSEGHADSIRAQESAGLEHLSNVVASRVSTSDCCNSSTIKTYPTPPLIVTHEQLQMKLRNS